MEESQTPITPPTPFTPEQSSQTLALPEENGAERWKMILIALFCLGLGAMFIVFILLLIRQKPVPASDQALTQAPRDASLTVAVDQEEEPVLPVFLSATQFGSNEDDTALSVAVDATGIYIVGETEGSLDGENAGDVSTATPGTSGEGVGAGHTFGLPDARDGFIEKYSLDGKTKMWGNQFGTEFRDTAKSVTVNNSGIYVSGVTEGSLDATIKGQSDVFLRKYDPDGSLVWAKQIGTNNRDESTWVVSDETRVCLGGGTLGSFDGFVKQGDEDIFARCYDVDGDELWTLQFGTSGFQETLGATIDEDGIYVVGATGDAIGDDKAVGGTDMWYGHISLDGVLLETHQFGSRATDFGHGIAVEDERVYIAGRTEGKLQGETLKGGSDAAIQSLSLATGDQLWRDQYGTEAGDASSDVFAYENAVYMIGVMNGKAEKHGEETDLEDGFVRKYTSDGAFVGQKEIATDGYDELRDIEIMNGIMYIVGQTGGEMGEKNYGAWDLFIARYQL